MLIDSTQSKMERKIHAKHISNVQEQLAACANDPNLTIVTHSWNWEHPIFNDRRRALMQTYDWSFEDISHFTNSDLEVLWRFHLHACRHGVQNAIATQASEMGLF